MEATVLAWKQFLDAYEAPRLLKDSGFPDRLLANLRQFDIPPERLMLEVQETAALVDRELCMDAFTRLRLGRDGSIQGGARLIRARCAVETSQLKILRTQGAHNG